METDRISRASFDKLVPFYVVKQSLRSCLCPHCYMGKLMMKSLVRVWPQLHCGDTQGSPCACSCHLCVDGGCTDFLPAESVKDVAGMGALCDLLLCEPVEIFKDDTGSVIKTHRNACVMGHCEKCRRRLRRFLQCPKHGRSIHDEACDSGEAPAAAPRELKWEVFVAIDENGNERPRSGVQGNSATRRARGSEGDEEDDDWEPQGYQKGTTGRKVRYSI